MCFVLLLNNEFLNETKFVHESESYCSNCSYSSWVGCSIQTNCLLNYKQTNNLNNSLNNLSYRNRTLWMSPNILFKNILTFFICRNTMNSSALVHELSNYSSSSLSDETIFLLILPYLNTFTIFCIVWSTFPSDQSRIYNIVLSSI